MVGGTDLHSVGAPSSRRVLAVLSPPCLHLSRGEHRIPAVSTWSPGTWGPVLLGTVLPATVSPAGNRAQPPPPRGGPPNPVVSLKCPRGLWCSALYGCQTTVCSAFPPDALLLCDSQNLEASLPFLRFCPISLLSTFPTEKIPAWIFKVPTSPGLGFHAPEAFTPLL